MTGQWMSGQWPGRPAVAQDLAIRLSLPGTSRVGKGFVCLYVDAGSISAVDAGSASGHLECRVRGLPSKKGSQYTFSMHA